MGLIWALLMETQIKRSINSEKSKLLEFLTKDSFRTSEPPGYGENLIQFEETKPYDDPPMKLVKTFEEARNALLLWCQQRTEGHEGVQIRDFKGSQDGKMFAALVHSMDAQALDYSQVLEVEQNSHNCKMDSFRVATIALEIAHRQFNIYPLLEAEDIVSGKCDEKSVVVYISEFLKYWNSEEKMMRDLGKDFSE